MCQQCLAALVHGEADGALVVAGGFQSQGVEGQEPSHGLAVGQSAEENQGGLMESLKRTRLNPRTCSSTFGGCYVDSFSDCLNADSPWPDYGDWTAVKPSGRLD